MNTRTSPLTAVASLCLAGLLTSCASTQVANVWKAPSLEQAAPRQILVLAVLGSPTSRRAVEDELVRQLGQAGIRAVAGYSVSPEIGDLPQPRLAQALAASGADAALVCRWQQVRQSTWTRALSSPNSNTPGRARQTAYGDATLLDGRTVATLWSAATTMEQVAGFREAAPEFAKTLVGSIQSDGALRRTAAAKTLARN
jgi:hypothetical protein